MEVKPANHELYDFKGQLKGKVPVDKKGVAFLKDRECNLHKSFKPMFLFGLFFGYFPIEGVTGPTYRSLRFRWLSPSFLYWLATLVGACFLSGMQMHKMVTKSMDLAELDRFYFFFTGVLAGLLFLRFCKNWPQLMKEWNEVEVAMGMYGWPVGLNSKMNRILAAFMVFALVEHILVQSNKLVLALACTNDTSEGLSYFLSYMSFSHIFSVVEFNVFKGLVIQTVNLQLTFIWTFIDVFLMIISTALAFRFKQISTRLRSMSDANVYSEALWKHAREDYDRLCKMCRRIDGEVKYIVLLAFWGDLFFILIQLFNSLKPLRNALERAYFYCSFALLIVKTICLCLFGAKVNDESKSPLDVLNSVSTNVYNLEIQRFVQQIGTSQVAITGNNLFPITRGTVLNIAGAIVTYELVLIQFTDRFSHKPEHIGSCPVFV